MLAAASPAAAQEPTTPTGAFTEEVSVRVLNIDVVVTDRTGKSVAGLSRDDFELRLDGETLPISNFYAQTHETSRRVSARDTDTQRDPSFRSLEEIQAGSNRRTHVVILVDHSRLRASHRKRAFNALDEAVASLGFDDLVSVVGIESGLVFYSDFLFDRAAISRILDDVKRVSFRSDLTEIERRQIFGELERGSSGGIQARASLAEDQLINSRIRAYANQEFERGIQSLRQIQTVVSTMAGIPGRKTLLYVGEGIPTRPGEGLYVEFRNRFAGPERGLRHTDFNNDYTRAVGNFDLTAPMQQLADSANRAGVTIYSIDANGNHGGDIRSALTEQGATSEAISVIEENYRAPLEFVSKATGGRLLLSSGKLADQLVGLVGEMRTFYSLGFTPPATWEPGSEHRVKVRIKGERYRVSHREEIRLPKADEREAGATVAALMYQTLDNPLQISAKPGFEVPREDEAAVLPINIEIPINKLGFLPKDAAQSGSLTIYVSTKDVKGNAGKVQKIPFHLAIPDDKMAEALQNSAHYPLPLVLRQGDQQVAIGVRDNVSGLFSAVRLDIAQYSRF
ncbi:MAG: VWA domain-containing protein [Acidobacteriota bacterium]